MSKRIKKPISLTRHGEKHFSVAFERPGRIEVNVTDEGQVVVFVYEGAEVDVDQEPVGAFDSTDLCGDWTA